MISILNEVRNIRSGRKELREFGLTIGILLLVLGGLAVWRGRSTSYYFFSIGSVFIGCGIFFPGILRLFQRTWMTLAVIIGFLMSRVILIALFYLVMTPIALVTKILRMDILDQCIEKDKVSYWKRRHDEVMNKEKYENQF